jgi:3-keto-5-aminohexanoate cleavage enzyme
MEDNVLYRRGEPLENNAQLVDRTVRIARELDRRPATPVEARARLGIGAAVGSE